MQTLNSQRAKQQQQQPQQEHLSGEEKKVTEKSVDTIN